MNSSGSNRECPFYSLPLALPGDQAQAQNSTRPGPEAEAHRSPAAGGERRSDKTRRKPCRHSSAVMGRSRRKAGSSSRARQSSCERCRQSISRFWLRCSGRARSDCSCPLHIWAPCVIARIGSVGRLSLPGRHRGASGKRQDDEYRGEPSMRVHCAENLSRSPL